MTGAQRLASVWFGVLGCIAVGIMGAFIWLTWPFSAYLFGLAIPCSAITIWAMYQFEPK
jgi:hypothetical protein